MERKFSLYSRESLTDKEFEVFSNAENDIELYKMSNDDILKVISDCHCASITDVKKCTDLINKYMQDYEEAFFGERLCKTLVMERPAQYVDFSARESIRLTEKDIMDIVDYEDRFALKFIILGAYEGIGTYDVADILETDADGINRQQKTITAKSGHIYKCSQKLIDIAVLSAGEDAYPDTKGRMIETVENGKIIRIKKLRSGKNTMSPAVLYNWLGRYREANGDERITLRRLYMSGFFNRYMEILKGRTYTKEIRPEFEDLLDQYNKKDLADTSLVNLKYYDRAIF